MFKIENEKITLIDENKQIVEFTTDGNGDYYFTLFSNQEARPGDYYSFFIDETNPFYNIFKLFLEQETNYSTPQHKTPYFIIDNTGVRIADQNRTIMESEFVKISSFQNKIKLTFSEKFPSSIRVNGIGRQDHYPYFIPIINLFNNIQNINVIIGTSCYQNSNSGNTVSITGDGGNAWGYFGPSYKKLAPSLKLYEYWRDNPDNLSDEQLIDYYIEEYFKHRLLDLDISTLLDTLKDKFGEKIILLCHELPETEIKKETFCHRRIVADFIELKSGIIIPEISINNQDKIITVEQHNYKPKLKKLIYK